MERAHWVHDVCYVWFQLIEFQIWAKGEEVSLDLEYSLLWLLGGALLYLWWANVRGGWGEWPRWVMDGMYRPS